MSGKWNYKALLHVIKLADGDDGCGLEVFYRVNKDETAVRVIVNCNDLFYWACADAEEITPADFPDIEQCVADLDAVDKENGHARFFATDLFCCRRRGMRPQGPWYGYMTKEGMVRRKYVPVTVEALFDACGPDRRDKSKRPVDGRRWDRGDSRVPADNPPEFIEMFQEGGQFGP